MKFRKVSEELREGDCTTTGTGVDLLFYGHRDQAVEKAATAEAVTLEGAFNTRQKSVLAGRVFGEKSSGLRLGGR